MDLIKQEQTMTSREIADIAGRRHDDVLRAIRNMEPAWEKVTDRKFAVSEYQDSTGRKLPMYKLTRRECLYVATKFNDEARAKLVIRWEELEKQRIEPGERSLFGNATVCVTYGELIPDIINENTLASLIQRGRVDMVRRGGGKGTPALIVYASLPEKYRKLYEAKYGDPMNAAGEWMIARVESDDRYRRMTSERLLDIMVSVSQIENHDLRRNITEQLMGGSTRKFIQRRNS